MNTPFVQDLIEKHEGFRATVYKDTVGKRTIGFGFNLDAPGALTTCRAHGLDFQALLNGQAITIQQAQNVALDQILACQFAARCQFPEFDNLPDRAQAAVIDMLFEMGSTGFAQFHDLIAALNAAPPNFKAAAAAMEQSKWAKQVPTRSQEDCALMNTAGALQNA